jgi:AraC family transcriptional regulator of adaptative response/methylated-DNA-[protein]-cysteine methyltransferase
MLDSNSHYTKVATAINHIKENFQEQPSLNELAELVNLSPFHFQRMFTDWAGVSPKKFMQFISVEYAKQLLDQQQISLLDTAYETGLSGTSRLHDLFINIEGMTPGEYKNSAQTLIINYSFANSPFGELLVASTPKGVCHLAFIDNHDSALARLKAKFSKAEFQQQQDTFQQDALFLFQNDWQSEFKSRAKIQLHLKGSDFQLKVWQALLKIPLGGLANYGQIAQGIDNPNASRAVGTAISNNPVAFLIPCHRVIQATGGTGQYRWGSTRKSAIIGWESAKCS